MHCKKTAPVSIIIFFSCNLLVDSEPKYRDANVDTHEVADPDVSDAADDWPHDSAADDFFHDNAVEDHLDLSVEDISQDGNDLDAMDTDDAASELLTWSKTYGTSLDSHIYDIHITGDNEYIILGLTNKTSEAGTGDPWLVKLDRHGVIIWENIYGGEFTDICYSMLVLPDNNVLIAGIIDTTGPSTPYDGWIVKIRGDLTIDWQKCYGGPDGEGITGIVEDGDGGYLFVGTEYNAEDAIGLTHIDANGEVLWHKTYGGEGWEGSNSIKHTLDGNYIIGGSSDSFGAGGKDFILLKVDGNGNIVWQKAYGGDQYETLSSFDTVSDGGYIMVGNTQTYGESVDFLVIKADSGGSIAWQKHYGSADNDEPSHIEQTAEGGYITCGRTFSFRPGNIDCWVLKLDSEGAIEWQKLYGGDEIEMTTFCTQTNDGGFIIGGISHSFRTDGKDIWLLKTDENGEIFGSCPEGMIVETDIRAPATDAEAQDADFRTSSEEMPVNDTDIAPESSSAIVETQCSG